MPKIKNYCEFVIKGLNQERFFNNLSKRYFLFDINRYERNKTSFKVSLRQFKRVKKEILAAGFEILGQSKRGIFAKIFDFKKSCAVISGILCFGVMFACQYQCVWKIDVRGVGSEVESQMVEFIKDNFVLQKGKIDCKNLEIALTKNIDNLSFASAAVLGQTLVVHAKEGESPIQKNGSFEPITASQDCRIVKIKLLQGTLAVHESEIVRKGETIVLPYIIDTLGEQKKVEPRVEVTLETYVQVSERHYVEEMVFERTGKSYVENNLFLFGEKIYSHGSKESYDNFEIEKSEKYYVNNNILPFLYQKNVYYETQSVLKKEFYESVREQKIALAREKALQKVENCDIIIKESCEEIKELNFVTINYTIVLQKEAKIK